MTKFDDVKPITKEERERVKAQIEILRQRALRAEERLKCNDADDYFFAVSGSVSLAEVDRLQLGQMRGGEKIFIQRVQETPLDTEVYSAIKQSHYTPLILSHAPFILSEIVVERGALIGKESLWGGIADVVIAAVLFLRRPVCIPFAADSSWGALAAHQRPAVEVELTRRGLHGGVPLGDKILYEAEAFKIAKSVDAIRTLRQAANFRIATESLLSSIDLIDHRVAIAAAWSGIEAIFGINSELRFRVAAYAASMLKLPGIARLESFRDVQRTYDTRSKAVHGSRMTEHELLSTRDVSLNLLIDLIKRVLELGSIPTTRELDEIVFNNTR